MSRTRPEEACPLETQVLTVAHPGPGIAQHPAEREAAKQPPAQSGTHSLLRRLTYFRLVADRRLSPALRVTPSQLTHRADQCQGIIEKRLAFEF